MRHGTADGLRPGQENVVIQHDFRPPSKDEMLWGIKIPKLY
jgi:hypothetical protein